MNQKKSIQNTSVLLGTDLLMSPIQRTQQNQISRLSYTPFGHRSQLPIMVTGFTGEPREPKINQYLLGNGTRPYSTPLMRFTAPDSSSPFDAGGINSYCYCGAQPITRSDHSGMAWLTALSALIFGTGTAMVTVGLTKPAGMSDELGSILMTMGAPIALTGGGLLAFKGVSSALKARRPLPTNDIQMEAVTRPLRNRSRYIDPNADLMAPIRRIGPPQRRTVVTNLMADRDLPHEIVDKGRGWTGMFLPKKSERFSYRSNVF